MKTFFLSLTYQLILSDVEKCRMFDGSDREIF